MVMKGDGFEATCLTSIHFFWLVIIRFHLAWILAQRMITRQLRKGLLSLAIRTPWLFLARVVFSFQNSWRNDWLYEIQASLAEFFRPFFWFNACIWPFWTWLDKFFILHCITFTKKLPQLNVFYKHILLVSFELFQCFFDYVNGVVKHLVFSCQVLHNLFFTL